MVVHLQEVSSINSQTFSSEIYEYEVPYILITFKITSENEQRRPTDLPKQEAQVIHS